MSISTPCRNGATIGTARVSRIMRSAMQAECCPEGRKPVEGKKVRALPQRNPVLNIARKPGGGFRVFSSFRPAAEWPEEGLPLDHWDLTAF